MLFNVGWKTLKDNICLLVYMTNKTGYDSDIGWEICGVSVGEGELGTQGHKMVRAGLEAYYSKRMSNDYVHGFRQKDVRRKIKYVIDLALRNYICIQLKYSTTTHFCSKNNCN